jgi:hypothetical protein
MSKSESSSTDDLADLFVSVTGDEEVTDEQDAADGDRELRDENRIDEAVADGLEDAIAGAQPDAGDPGEASG